LVGRDVDGAVAFAELGAARRCEQRRMGVGRRGPAQGLVEGNVLGGRDEPFLREVVLSATKAPLPPDPGGPITYHAADDMGDFHEVVVDHVCEVVGREAIRLEEDEVVLVFQLGVLPVDEILEGDARLRWPEANDVRLAGVGSLLRVSLLDPATCARVACISARVERLLLVLIEALGTTEAAICRAFLKHAVGYLTVVDKPL
jgi:hypothetical protein